jgi:putative transposase
MDRYLDTTQKGPIYLGLEPIANLVIASLHRGVEIGYFELRAYVLMANHVHVWFLPRIPPPRLFRALKGVTAREANKLLGRTGECFWQGESCDHWVRNDTEMDRIIGYIENNPVKAGMDARAAGTSARASHVISGIES